MLPRPPATAMFFLELRSQEMKFTQCPSNSLNMKTERICYTLAGSWEATSLFLARKSIFVSNLALRHVTPPECLGINTHEPRRASSSRMRIPNTAASQSQLVMVQKWRLCVVTAVSCDGSQQSAGPVVYQQIFHIFEIILHTSFLIK